MDSTVSTPKHDDSKHIFKKKQPNIFDGFQEGVAEQRGKPGERREARQPTLHQMEATFTTVRLGKQQHPRQGEERTTTRQAGICTAWTSQTTRRFPQQTGKGSLQKTTWQKWQQQNQATGTREWQSLPGWCRHPIEPAWGPLTLRPLKC